MHIIIQMGSGGLPTIQVTSEGYQPDVFDDLMNRCQRAAVELWLCTHAPAEPKPQLKVKRQDQNPRD